MSITPEITRYVIIWRTIQHQLTNNETTHSSKLLRSVYKLAFISKQAQKSLHNSPTQREIEKKMKLSIKQVMG